MRAEARAEGIWLNAIDQPDLCDFITPALVRRGNLTIAISTNGRCPGFARKIRQDLERHFGPEYADLVEEMGQQRDKAIAERAGEPPVEARQAACGVLTSAPDLSARGPSCRW